MRKWTFTLQAVLAVFLWASSKIIIKEGLLFLPPYRLAGLIQLTAFLILLLSMAATGRKIAWPKNPLIISSLILISLMGFVGAPLFAVIGLQYATGSLAGLLAGLNAVFVLFLGWAILGEKPVGNLWLGFVLSLLGAFLFLSTLAGQLLGLTLLVVAEVGFALTTVLMRKIVKSHSLDPFLISLIGTFLGSVVLLPLGILVDGLPGRMGSESLLVILSLGLIFAYASGLWYNALGQLRALEASLINNTILFQVLLLSAVFLGETITPIQLIGGFLVVAGALLGELPPLFLKTQTA